MELDIFNYAAERDFGEVHFKNDNATGLQAIIAIHSLKRGPALGGCRCIEYPNSEAALLDAFRLARAMSFKSVLMDLPQGGGKAVLIKPKNLTDRTAYFQAFGRFVDELNGKYITAIDSGTDVADMDIIGTQTSYVTSLSSMNGETSHFTALGVKWGLEAAIKFRLQRDDFQDLTVAIQGVGNVGYFLAKELHQLGAKLVVCDVNQAAVDRCVNEFNATACAIEEIYDVNCDIFSPCALGAVINEDTLPRLKAKIIAGCANNQLATLPFGEQVHRAGICYAPDYVVNAGGLIYAACKYNGVDETVINDKLATIYELMLSIFERSKLEDRPTSLIADQIALERLAAA